MRLIMNLFNLDIEKLDADEAKEVLNINPIEKLPNIPPFLSKKDCSIILGVSMKVINKLTESGELPIIDIPDDISVCTDLFGEQVELPREKCILRADLVIYMEKALLCNKPVLDP